MNLIIEKSKDYKKDIKRIKLNSKKSTLNRIEEIINIFINNKLQNKVLDESFNDHDLNDNRRYKGYRECHILGDLLLVYRIESNKCKLMMLRLNTHSELFEVINEKHNYTNKL